MIECNRCCELKETWWLPRVWARARSYVCVCIGEGDFSRRISHRYTDATACSSICIFSKIGYALESVGLKAWPRKPSEHAGDKVSWEMRLTARKSNLAVGYEIGAHRKRGITHCDMTFNIFHATDRRLNSHSPLIEPTVWSLAWNRPRLNWEKIFFLRAT